MCEIEKSQIAIEILAYLTEHPDAKDTFEGIGEWWLLEREIRRRTVQIKEALGELVARKFILERKGLDSRIHYQVNPRKLRQIRALIKSKL
jgi:hypothetical protein